MASGSLLEAIIAEALNVMISDDEFTEVSENAGTHDGHQEKGGKKAHGPRGSADAVDVSGSSQGSGSYSGYDSSAYPDDAPLYVRGPTVSQPQAGYDPLAYPDDAPVSYDESACGDDRPRRDSKGFPGDKKTLGTGADGGLKFRS